LVVQRRVRRCSLCGGAEQGQPPAAAGFCRPRAGAQRRHQEHAYGVEAELFVNYLVTPNIEIGAGGRYWGLASRMGDVSFGPAFDNTNQLTNFDQERYGVLVHAKGRF